MNCVILEDQLPAQRLLTSYVEQCANLHLVATFIDPLIAREYLMKNTAQVLFLDIHLPGLTGLDLLGSLPAPPQVIITTAFEQYALRGYEFAVVDYLLKPYSFERFQQAVQRLAPPALPVVDDKLLFVKNKFTIYKVTKSEVLYVVARGDFVQLQLIGRKVTANTSLVQLLAELGPGFARCHKSYLVNLQLIDRVYTNKVVVLEREIPIGRAFRESFFEVLRYVG